MPFRKSSSLSEPINIVSGLPRSGTSMMMKMLQAGGMTILSDGERTADPDNPKGYYEHERVKKLKEGDMSWLLQAQGKVLKVVSPLLEFLPQDYEYRVFFMRRNLDEILVSQRQMLVRRNEPTDKVSDEQMAALYRKHLRQVETWLQSHPHINVNYRQVIEEPEAQVNKIVQFSANTLDTQPMLAVVDPDLYRQRK
jgi:hypothetical protein